MPVVRETVGGFAREFAGDAVDLEGAVLQIELAECYRGAAETIGFHHVGPGRVIASMDVAHEVGSREIQHLGAVLSSPEILLDIERQRLDAAAHPPVAEQNLVAKGVE